MEQEKELMVNLSSSYTSLNLAACTIISKNYLSRARVLANSFLQYHPGIPFFVLLVDTVDNYFEPAEERFTLLQIDELPISDLNRFCFQYTLFELSCAVKPYFFHHLFAKYGFAKLIYFDSDILILRNLSRLFALLDDYSIILTPHLTAPLAEDGCIPNEVSILQAGAYNAGFLALALAGTTQEFLTWWQARLQDKCRVDVEHGIYVDQKWLDLVPGLFEGVYILREPGFDIAYWNLSARAVDVGDASIRVNGQPGYFFHFSGFDADNPEIVSKYNTRFNIHNVGQAAKLFKKYAALLSAAGERETQMWPYAYGCFDNGVKIPDAARHLYMRLGNEVCKFGNPFDATSPNSYFNWLTSGADNDPDPASAISRLWYDIYSLRPDLQRAFPNIFGTHRNAFLEWIVQFGLNDYSIPDRFAAPSLKRETEMRYKKKSEKINVGYPFGVNLAGPIASEKGVGEALRSAIRILDAAQIPYVLNDFEDPGSANIESTLFIISHDNPYNINLSVTGVDAVPIFAEQKGRSYFDKRYTIGHWAWELADLPRGSLSSFQYFDEIWVASSFIQNALSRISPVPVVTVPYTVTGELPNDVRHRLHFGLPRDTFVFLFMFDFHSITDRKNPFGLIKAFKRAFGPKDDALLLLKCAHSRDSSSELQAVQEASKGANIRIYDCVLSREQINTLMYLSDCYVSLHRAEGFGLTMAEAMSMGKPVIATGYSGNMDFMTSDNSFPIKYKLIPIERDQGPYKRGFVWAEPDLDHAAELMRHVYENRDRAKEVGRQARQDVLAALHPQVMGAQVRKRLLQVT